MDVQQRSQETFIKTLVQGQAALPKDVKVIVGAQTFDCHESVLSLWSDYFRAAFESGMKEQTNGTIKLPDGDFVTSTSFQQLYNFMYTSKIEISPDTVYALISSAHYLRMPTVLVLCTGFLTENAAAMTEDLALQLANLQADDLSELRQNSVNKIAENFTTFVASGRTLQGMSVETLEAVLQSARLRAQNEAEIFNVVLRWLDSDPARAQHGDRMLCHVRLGLVPGTVLLAGLDNKYQAHLGQYSAILRDIIACCLDKNKEEETRAKYKEHYQQRPLVTAGGQAEVLASLSPGRKMLVFTEDRGWHSAGEKLPETRSNYLVVGSALYIVSPKGMLNRYDGDTRAWRKVAKVPCVTLHQGNLVLLHKHPDIYILQGQYNFYYDYNRSVWGQVSPLPIPPQNPQYENEALQAGAVMHDGRIVVTWNKMEANNAQQLGSAVYDKNTNIWTPLGAFEYSHNHCILSHETTTLLINKAQTVTNTGAVNNGFYFSEAWYNFQWGYHGNNIGALVNPMTAKDILVTFGGVATATAMTQTPQGYYPCLEEGLLKLNPDNGLQVTLGEGDAEVTPAMITEDATVMYVPRELCC